MKQPIQTFKLEKQEQDLRMITHSLNYACCVKYNDRRLSVDKENLIFKIVDNCNVNPAKAKEYLMILQSRGIVEVDRDLVHYIKNEFTEKQSKIIDNFFVSLNSKEVKS